MIEHVVAAPRCARPRCGLCRDLRYRDPERRTRIRCSITMTSPFMNAQRFAWLKQSEIIEAEQKNADTVIMIQGDEPMVTPDMIDRRARLDAR